MQKFNHIPVLAGECIEGLAIKPGGIYVDGTCGGGGHSSIIAERLGGSGRLVCVDRDTDAINAASERLKEFNNVIFEQDNFTNINDILDRHKLNKIHGVLLDLGVSSWQLDEPSRGFSFLNDAQLDMRMDRSNELSAYDVVNNYNEERLKKIISEYGEERYAGRIARNITKERADKPIGTTLSLADLVCKAIPRAAWEQHKHPATRTFQAIRIEVNNELDNLGQALCALTARLETGGRLCCITFHSLEDRIVKNTFKTLADPCECPRNLPYCVCKKEPAVKLISKKPILPAQDEINTNPRSRSAKLRIAEKI